MSFSDLFHLIRSKSIHVVTNGKIFFFRVVFYYVCVCVCVCVNVCHIVIHLLMGSYGYFHILASVKYCWNKQRVCISFQISVFVFFV